MLAAVAAIVLLHAPTPDNTLTTREVREGWKLLFDGKTTNGWHNFKETGIHSGWEVKDGVLKSVNAGDAGDIVTNDKYDWFELQLDYKLEKGQNSGIMFHVADDGGATWFSGPEIQIYDDHGEEHAQKSGYLYDLYSSPVDSTKPVGQWNHFRIIISPKKCATYVNGVKYYEYVLNSPDFKERVAKSKFHEFPQFATLPTGTICIQGDHGVVSFKNIKLKPLKG